MHVYLFVSMSILNRSAILRLNFVEMNGLNDRNSNGENVRRGKINWINVTMKELESLRKMLKKIRYILYKKKKKREEQKENRSRGINIACRKNILIDRTLMFFCIVYVALIVQNYTLHVLLLFSRNRNTCKNWLEYCSIFVENNKKCSSWYFELSVKKFAWCKSSSLYVLKVCLLWLGKLQRILYLYE